MMRDRVETISLDHPCAKCGYSLRTLRLDGVCPECGFDVSQSLLSAGDRLILYEEEQIVAAEPRYAVWRRWSAHAAWASIAMLVLSLFAVPLLHRVLELPERRFERLVIGLIAASMMAAPLSLLAWWGCRARCLHAEFVRATRAGAMGERSEADRRRDDHVCRREGIYIRNLGAAKALFWLLVIAMAMGIGIGFAMGRFPFALKDVAILFWLALLALLVWISTGRRAHARSIRYHRRLDRHRPGSAEATPAKAGAM